MRFRKGHLTGEYGKFSAQSDANGTGDVVARLIDVGLVFKAARTKSRRYYLDVRSERTFSTLSVATSVVRRRALTRCDTFILTYPIARACRGNQRLRNSLPNHQFNAFLDVFNSGDDCFFDYEFVPEVFLAFQRMEA